MNRESDATVLPAHIVRAAGAVAGRRLPEALRRLRELEPYLAGYIDREHEGFRYLLGRGRCARGWLDRIAESQRTMVLIAVEAVRQAHYTVWRDSPSGGRAWEMDSATSPETKHPASRTKASRTSVPPAQAPIGQVAPPLPASSERLWPQVSFLRQQVPHLAPFLLDEVENLWRTVWRLSPASDVAERLCGQVLVLLLACLAGAHDVGHDGPSAPPPAYPDETQPPRSS